jgi:hypothetical protein
VRAAWAAAFVLVAGLHARPVRALTVDAASVTLGGRQADAFRVKGSLVAVSFDGAEAVVVRLEHARVRLPLSRFKRRKQKLEYRGPAGPGALSRVRLDLRRRRFLVTGSGWALAGLSNPFALAVGTDDAEECRMLLLAERPGALRAGRRGAARRRLAIKTTGGNDGGCGRLEKPTARPVFVRAGTPTDVEVRVDVTPGAGIDPTSLRVLRAGAGGDALCALAARPEVSPQRFACTVTIDEATPAVLRLFVEARAGTGTLVSPGFVVPVIDPAAIAGPDPVPGASAEATRIWQEAEARLGDGFEARVETIRALASVPGVLAAGLSPNGIDIVFRYTNGVEGFLVLNRPESAAAAAAAARPALVPAPAPAAGNAVFLSCADPGSAPDARCCTAERRTPLLGREVLLWNPGFFGEGRDDARVVAAKFAENSCLGHQITTVTGTNANIASLAQFTRYPTVIISSHGVVVSDNLAALCTGEEAPDSATLRARYPDLVAKGMIGVASGPSIGDRRVLCVTSDYIGALPGSFPPGAIVYASHCFSAWPGMREAYTLNGAGASFGYSWAVSEIWTTATVAPTLFDGLLRHMRTAKKAFEAIQPNVDTHPQPWTKLDPNDDTKVIRIPGAAKLVLEPPGSLVAYVGTPRLTPDESQISGGGQATLAVEVEGKESCELTHHWHNEAEHGHLEGGDDVEGTQPERTYAARPGAESGSDPIGAEVLPPGSDEPLGVACAQVTVLTDCGDGVRQETEQCDGTDDTACPGRCEPGCTCRPDGTRLDVEIVGLPQGIAWSIQEDPGLTGGGPQRISCPPTCSYQSPSGPHGIIRLLTYPVEDPRTGDFPFDILSMTGCKGTSVLPAADGLCALNGDESKVVVTLRYRPILAVGFAGTAAGGLPNVSGSATTGDGVGFGCGGAAGLLTRNCARHYQPGASVFLQAYSDEPGNPLARRPSDLVSWDGPCAGQGIGSGSNRCEFTLGTTDTCITATWRKSPTYPHNPPTDGYAVSGPPCPTGAVTP